MKNSKIAMPTVYVPTWKDVGLQHSLGVAGVLDWSLIDRKNYTKPVVVKRGRQRNKIMLEGFNKTHGLPRMYAAHRYLYTVWQDTSVQACMVIGTGTAEPNITDTDLTIPLSTSSYHSGYQVQYSNQVRPSYLHSVPVTFDESVGNGDLTEWGIFLRTQNSMGYNKYFWCKELFRDEQGVPVVITKTSDHLLRLQYQLYWDAPPQQQSIINIDGANYTVTTTIADRHVLGFACSGYINDPPKLTATLGTDNTPTLNTDYDIKGSAILSNSKLENLDYNAESHTLSYELELVGSQANSSIGEIALYNITSYEARNLVPASQPICRTTIDPLFTKTSTQKLKLYYEITSMPDAYDLIKIPTLYDEPGAQASIHSLAMYD